MNKLFKAVAQISMINFVVLSLFIFIQSKSAPKNITPTTTPLPVTNQPAPTQNTNDISVHNNKSDCWIQINNHIYDVTNYFGQHPGGDQLLLKYCGKNGTQGWQTKESIPAIIHSKIAEAILAQFLIQ